MISKYRVDFSRLTRSMDEIQRQLEVFELMDRSLPSVAKEKVWRFNESLPEGHILDYVMVIDKAGMFGKDILEKHIKPFIPEAVLTSWDEIPLHEKELV